MYNLQEPVTKLHKISSAEQQILRLQNIKTSKDKSYPKSQFAANFDFLHNFTTANITKLGLST
jgi:hypothetical protein